MTGKKSSQGRFGKSRQMFYFKKISNLKKMIVALATPGQRAVGGNRYI
jgi:hypothetical protein